MGWVITRWGQFICSMTQRHSQNLDRCHQMQFLSLNGMDKILFFTIGIRDKKPPLKSHKPQTNWRTYRQAAPDNKIIITLKSYWKILQECHQELLCIHTAHPEVHQEHKVSHEITFLFRFEFVPACKPKSINIAIWVGVCLMLFRGMGCTIHMVT